MCDSNLIKNSDVISCFNNQNQFLNVRSECINFFLPLKGSCFLPVDSYRYCTLHCTGYMRSWPSSQLDPEGDSADVETSSLNCLVMMCRLHPHISYAPSKDISVKATEFVTRCAIDGKFTFVDQQ